MIYNPKDPTPFSRKSQTSTILFPWIRDPRPSPATFLGLPPPATFFLSSLSSGDAIFFLGLSPLAMPSFSVCPYRRALLPRNPHCRHPLPGGFPPAATFFLPFPSSGDAIFIPSIILKYKFWLKLLSYSEFYDTLLRRSHSGSGTPTQSPSNVPETSNLPQVMTIEEFVTQSERHLLPKLHPLEENDTTW
ncbi:unnamed protein product [Arabis nemorensis]|uniref:Uncharacterized protein n=1 Tax=Arabis nemorensis TaxID=586526 RepID=A0A565BHJ7_9BRAS|nr:unnamed protein product [Arabis nemorensis]